MSLIEMRQLLQKAGLFVCGGRPHSPVSSNPSLFASLFNRVDVFYRNKPISYYNEIMQCRYGIMEVYWKDQNGDPLCPINGRLQGLFFSASPYQQIPSPFGPRCLSVLPSYLYESAENLYFADFYCKRPLGPHYVTIVMARPGSRRDMFCRQRLLPLNPLNNIFLRMNGVFAYVNRKVHVEVFYTEDVDVNEVLFHEMGWFTNVPATGTSSARGIRKNALCSLCNIVREVPYLDQGYGLDDGTVQGGRKKKSKKKNRQRAVYCN